MIEVARISENILIVQTPPAAFDIYELVESDHPSSIIFLPWANGSLSSLYFIISL